MNIFRTIRNAGFASAFALMVCLSGSCSKDDDFSISGSGGADASLSGSRLAFQESRRVLVFYECGFNSLYGYLYDDVNTELAEGFIPGSSRKDNILIVYSKLASNANYRPVKSYLRRLYKDSSNKVVSDTLKVFDESTVATSSETMKEVLTFVKENFSAKSYGLVFSSHGSGWLPAGYYASPSAYERNHAATTGSSSVKTISELNVPSGNMETDDPYAGWVRSIGQDKMSDANYEMTTQEFTNGIPFHLDYLLFDMCFSSGLEVLYALKDAADYIGASPAEVLADGMFDYTKVSSFLIGSSEPDLKGLFVDSFERYDKKDGQARSSTVNLVKTDGLDNLASVCKELFEKYREKIDDAPTSDIQGYFRANRHYFYDIEDTFVKCGASDEDLSALRKALDSCVVYKNATPSFLDLFKITTYSGFSIYLPCDGTTLLNSIFKDEAWNIATGLFK